jgi:hypothetical protein
MQFSLLAHPLAGVVARSRVFDASTVNGGPIDSLIHLLGSGIWVLAAALLIGLASTLYSQPSRAPVWALAAGALLGGALARAGIAWSAFLWLGLAAAVAGAVLMIAARGRAGSLLVLLLAAGAGLFTTNGTIGNVASRETRYVIPFIVTLAVSALSAGWVGQALGLGLRPRVGRASGAQAGLWWQAVLSAPGAYLLAVLVCASLLFGLVDLAAHTSKDRAVLGLYSLPLLLATMAAAAVTGVALFMVFRRDGVARLRSAIAAWQRRPLLVLAALPAYALLLASMFTVRRWQDFPVLEIAVLAIGALLIGAALLGPAPDGARAPAWRKALLIAGAVLLTIEAGLQGAAAAGALPFNNLSGLHIAYGRVYQSGEGFTHGIANRLGWYDLNGPGGGRRRVVITGDDYVQALQVAPADALGPQLQGLLAARGAHVTQLGFPGYGAALHADPRLAPFTLLQYQPDEVIVVFHVLNDLQAPQLDEGLPRAQLDASGVLTYPQAYAGRRHALQHLAIRAYDPINPVITLQSHLFTVQLLRRALNLQQIYREYGDLGAPPAFPRNVDAAGETQPFGLLTPVFADPSGAQATQAFALAGAQLKAYRAALAELGITMKLVTLPYFPPEYLEASSGAGWNARYGEYDLLAPERALTRFARSESLDILPLGEYLQRSGATIEDIRGLYFNGGRGHLTAAGHAYVAQAIASCLFAAGPACPLAP